MTFVGEFYQRADAFLFGRRTYEIFAGYWGAWEDLEDPIVGGLNTQAQVRGIEHAHRPALGGHDRPLR